MAIRRRLLIAGSVFCFLVVAGTSGYMLIEGWTLLDALYQTITTLATVGFGEIHPLSNRGRVFTMVLIVGGVGAVYYTLTMAVALAVEGELGDYVGRRRMHGRIAALRGHYIVCGYGRVGREIVRELRRRQVAFVVIDSLPDNTRELHEQECDYIEGNATDDAVLVAAGVEHAAGLLAAVDADTENTYIVLSARALNPKVFIVARASLPGSEAKMVRAGADRVISPYRIAGQHMAVSAIQPAVVDFMTPAFRSQQGDLILAELTVTDASGLSGQTLDGVFGVHGAATVLGLRRPDGQMLAGPPGHVTLEAGDQVFVLGPPDALESFVTRTGATVPTDRRRRVPRLIPPRRRERDGPLGGH